MTLPITHNNFKFIPSIVDGGSGLNIISRKLYDEWNLPKIEEAPFSIKLADQSRVSPLGLMNNVPIRIVGVCFLVAFVVMNLPPHSSSYSIPLRRMWLKVVAIMHDWKNNTLMLQSRYGLVKVNLWDGRIRHVIPRGLEPSSSTSMTTHTTLDSQIPSELGSDYVMNWIEALATIYCLMLGIETSFEEIDRVSATRSLEEVPLPKTPEEMLKAFKDDELKEGQREEGILHLNYLAKVDSLEEVDLRKEEAKAKHNIPNKRESNGVLTEHLAEKELKAKLQEDADQEPIP